MAALSMVNRHQAIAFALLEFDQPSIHLIPGNPETVGNFNGDTVNKLIKPDLRAKELYLLQEPLRVEQLSFTLVLLKLPNDIDKLFVVFLQRVQDVSNGIKLLGFNSVIKAVTIYSSKQRDQHVANGLCGGTARLAHGPTNSLNDVDPALARINKCHHVDSGDIDALS